MGIVAFRPCITVRVEEQTTGKPLSVLRFAPTTATAGKLQDCRLVFRPRENGFQLYAQYNPEASNARLAPIAGRISFVFGGWLTQPDFLDRYHPTLDQGSGPCLYLANLDNDGSVRASGGLSSGATVEKADGARIVARRLLARADMSVNPKPTSLKVTDRLAPTRVVANAPVTAGASATSATVAIDLSHDAALSYTLAPQPAGKPKTTLFSDEELAGQGVFAVLELVANPALGADPPGGRTYVARFRRRS